MLILIVRWISEHIYFVTAKGRSNWFNIFHPFSNFMKKQKTKKNWNHLTRNIFLSRITEMVRYSQLYTKLILYFKIYKCLKIVRGVVGGCISKMRRERERELTKSGNRISVECLPQFFFLFTLLYFKIYFPYKYFCG